jgi:hypothetical protein
VVELKGSLGGVGLPAVVQLIAELHHSGTLELSRGDARGRLAFDDGRLVAAECGPEHGLQAVAMCARDLAGADFVFVESDAVDLDKTLDLGPTELNKVLNRLQGGELTDFETGTSANGVDGEHGQACPLLGFADDRAHHYSRPTALHRCFATGAAALVSSQEQRELCLGGGFAACARYRGSEQAMQAPVVVQATPTATAPAAYREVPAGVAARLAAVGAQMHFRSPTELNGSARVANGRADPGHAAPPAPSVDEDGAAASRRRLLLIAAGVVAGLILLVAIFGALLPALRGGPEKAPVAASVTSEVPVTAPTVQPTSVTALTAPLATSVPATAPATPPAPRLAAASTGGTSTGAPAAAAPTAPAATTNTGTGTAVAAPTVAAATTNAGTGTAVAAPAAATNAAESSAAGEPTPAAPGKALVDLRLAAGPPNGWLANPPYAGWSDGAYRLVARQANQFVAVGIPVTQVPSNVIVSATFRKTGGPPGGGYGLIVRDQDAQPGDGVNQQFNAYVFETGDKGEYGVWRRDGDHWVDLVPWTPTGTVRPGGSPNDLVVNAADNRLVFTVNGVQLASVQDTTFPAGGIGIFVGGDYNEVAVDHFALQAPD